MTENLKVLQATGISLQQLTSAVSQAVSCLYVGNMKVPLEDKEKGGKSFAGTTRHPKPTMG